MFLHTMGSYSLSLMFHSIQLIMKKIRWPETQNGNGVYY